MRYRYEVPSFVEVDSFIVDDDELYVKVLFPLEDDSEVMTFVEFVHEVCKEVDDGGER